MHLCKKNEGIYRGEDTGFPPQLPIDRSPCFPHYSPSGRACPLIRPLRLPTALPSLCVPTHTASLPLSRLATPLADRLAPHSYCARLSPVLSRFSYLVSILVSVSFLVSHCLASRLVWSSLAPCHLFRNPFISRYPTYPCTRQARLTFKSTWGKPHSLKLQRLAW